jgi:formamidopyrimidine-DNA glycosylase
MPELPEVESARSLVEKHCMKSKIIQVNVLEQGNGPRHGLFDDIVCDIKKEECNNDDTISKTNSSFEQNDFQSALLHRKIVKVCRKGKQIWFELDGTGPSLLFHFGMTGAFTIKDIQASTYKSFKVDCTEWPPKFTKFEVIFENGTQLAFCDPRRLGRIRIRYGNPRSCPPISKLARDPIIEGLTYEYMESCLSKYSSNIKSVLLDQEKIVSGIGNWVADEVLYQADIHPSTICSSISSKKAKDLVDKLIYILTTAIQVDARSEDFPSDWLFHYRWSKRNGEKKSPLKMPNGIIIIITKYYHIILKSVHHRCKYYV